MYDYPFSYHLSNSCYSNQRILNTCLHSSDHHALAHTRTGDTDFLPAMVRTRQKGKRVVLSSMRNGCNRDILNPEAHALDMNVVWLDDHLDELIVPDATKSSLLNSGSSSPVPADVLTEIIAGILEKNGGSLKSRDVGRQLQSTKVNTYPS
jgi:hypothetical protein